MAGPQITTNHFRGNSWDSKIERASGNFAWVCICIMGGGHFSFPDANADPGTTGLALRVDVY